MRIAKNRIDSIHGGRQPMAMTPVAADQSKAEKIMGPGDAQKGRQPVTMTPIPGQQTTQQQTTKEPATVRPASPHGGSGKK